MTLPLVNENVKATYTTPLGFVIDFTILALVEEAAYVQTIPLDFGVPLQEKYIDAVRVELTAPTTPFRFSVQIGWQDDLSLPIEWSEKYYLTKTNELIKDFRLQGRYISVRMADEFPSVPWEISRLVFYGHVVGDGRL